ncbi:hypothetical protein [Paraburkholderia ferrariae]|uniref:hypothetical protein n=1 Tax=Paraburkholderia ferrariae TaxID=386056 RepID=UPI000AFA4A1B|nr:hypothetical protein [Paraburkholderia ferrariae]
MFDVDRWFHFAWPACVPREAHDDIVQGMQEASAAWLKHAESTLLSHPSHELRDMLGRSGNRFHMKTMDNRQVAKALYNEVKDGNLLFVPERDLIRKCVEAIRKQREKGTRQAPAGAQEPTGADVAKVLHDNSPRAPQNLSNVRPFEYMPDAMSDDAEELAASTNNPRYAARMLGYDQNTFSDMLHAMKQYNKLRGDNNVIWHDDGDVEFNGVIIDNMHSWAP